MRTNASIPMPKSRIQESNIHEIQPLELPDSKYSSLYSYDYDLNSMDNTKRTYVCLFLFLSVVSQNSIITLMKKLFSSSWMKLNSSFFLSFYRWTLMALGRQVVWKLNENSGKIQQKQASMIKKDRKNCKTLPSNFYLLDRTTNRLNWHLSHCEHFVSYVSGTFILIFKVVSCIFNFFLFLHISNKI